MTVGLASLQGLRLLVVEDESLIAMMIEDMLRDFGCEVIGPASSVSHALALLERETIDGAVLDVNLSGGQRSYPIAEALKRRGIPFAFVTGYGEAGLIAEFQGVRVLQKPFVSDHLRRVICDDIAAAI
jgi:CheY-like chemotaxis protein